MKNTINWLISFFKTEKSFCETLHYIKNQKVNGGTRKANPRVGKKLNTIIMKKLDLFKIALALAISTTGALAQTISSGTGGTIAPNAPTSNVNVGIGTTNPTAALHLLTGTNPGMLPPNIKLDRNDGTNQAGLFTLGISSNGFASGLLGGGSAYFKLEDPYGNSQNSDMGFSTNGNAAQFVIKHNGFVGIGTETPTAQLEVTTTMVNNPAITANGKSIGIYAEATAQESSLIPYSASVGDKDGIAVLGNAKYTSSTANGSMYGIVGIANQTNPLNNIGVFGTANSASGYNTGVLGVTNVSSGGIYNSAIKGSVDNINSSAVYNRAIDGKAPVAPNHYAGYFDGNVEMQTGTVKIGNVTTPSGYKLYVEQGILTEKVKVAIASTAAWADYVFADNYSLKPLSEVEAFIKQNKHLPNVPSATALTNEGLDLAKMQATQMEKIEELTLYLIEMKKEIESLKKSNAELKAQSLSHKN